MENINPQTNSTQVVAQKYVPDDNTTYRPILSYTYYIFLRIIKNKSTWILLIISFIISLVLGFAPILISTKAQEIKMGLSILGTIGPMVITIFSMVFGVIKSLNIFSDSQSDGTELLIVSKPITRTQLIITRFIFLLIVGLLFSLLMFLAWTIGLAIVGFEHVNDITVSLLGVWAASFISFMITSVITILIALKFSSRAARVLPLIIMSVSAMIGVFPMVAGAFFNSEISRNEIANISNTINTNYASLPPTEKFSLDNKSNGPNLTVDKFEFDDGNNSYYYQSPFKLSNDSGGHYLYLERFSVSAVNGDIVSFSISDLINGNYRYGTSEQWKAVYNFAIEQAANALSNYSVNASGIVAINFINPMSAFYTIAGTTGDNMLSSYLSFSDSAIFNSNYSYSNFIHSKDQIGINFNNYLDGSYQDIKIPLPSSIKIDKVTQVDSPLFVGILWFAIFMITISLCVIVYYRKDFK